MNQLGWKNNCDFRVLTVCCITVAWWYIHHVNRCRISSINSSNYYTNQARQLVVEVETIDRNIPERFWSGHDTHAWQLHRLSAACLPSISGGQHLTWTRWQQRCPGGISGWVTRRVVEYKWKVLPPVRWNASECKSFLSYWRPLSCQHFIYLSTYFDFAITGGRCGRNAVANTSTSSCFGFTAITPTVLRKNIVP